MFTLQRMDTIALEAFCGIFDRKEGFVLDQCSIQSLVQKKVRWVVKGRALQLLEVSTSDPLIEIRFGQTGTIRKVPQDEFECVEQANGPVRMFQFATKLINDCWEMTVPIGSHGRITLLWSSKDCVF